MTTWQEAWARGERFSETLVSQMVEGNYWETFVGYQELSWNVVWLGMPNN